MGYGPNPKVPDFFDPRKDEGASAGLWCLSGMGRYHLDCKGQRQDARCSEMARSQRER